MRRRRYLWPVLAALAGGALCVGFFTVLHMRGLFLALTGGSVLLSLAFIAALGDPRKHPDRGIAWFLASTGWAGLAVDLVLFVALLGASVNPWWLAAALAVQDTVFTWRLWLSVRARLRQRTG